MSSSLEQHRRQVELSLPAVDNMRVAVIKTQWNAEIVDALEAGVLEQFRACGMDIKEDVDCFTVPGAIELTFAASQCIEAGLWDAVIVLGCVIRGGTPHFDYVCQSVTQGVTALNADCDIPVIFGVLTVDNIGQARQRAGGDMGNKGAEYAQAAINMVSFSRTVKDM